MKWWVSLIILGLILMELSWCMCGLVRMVVLVIFELKLILVMCWGVLCSIMGIVVVRVMVILFIWYLVVVLIKVDVLGLLLVWMKIVCLFFLMEMVVVWLCVIFIMLFCMVVLLVWNMLEISFCGLNVVVVRVVLVI